MQTASVHIPNGVPKDAIIQNPPWEVKFEIVGSYVKVRAKDESVVDRGAREIQHCIDLYLRRAEIRESLLAQSLIGNSGTEVEMEYSGEGDEGDIQECSHTHPDHDVSEFLWDLMWTLHAGFENNDGGRGTVSWDLKTDKITIDHGDAFIDYTTTKTEL